MQPRTRARVGVVARIATKTPTLTPQQKQARTKLRALYRKVKESAIARDNAEHQRKHAQEEAIDIASANDMTDRPIRFSIDGKVYQGTITIPTASPYWDDEAVVDYLHKSGKWDDCSSRVFDQQKWEAEIALGNIPKRIAEKLLHPGIPRSPYVRITEV